MSTVHHSKLLNQPSNRKKWLFIGLFVLLTAIGLSYVKWWPYYLKALTAMNEHSIGTSILTGINTDQALSIWESALQYTITYFKSVWKAALLGMLIATLIQALLPANWLYQLLGRSSMKSTVLGGAASIPGMMCSCCAAPIASGMRKQQVSVGASLAFWLGNPLLNPATLIFMTFVLSWKYTVLRLVFGLLITFGVSYAANRFARQEKITDAIAAGELSSREDRSASVWIRWGTSFGKMVLQVAPVYLISVFALAALQSYMFPVWLNEGIAAIILFAIVGALFVIPTAAEIPIIQSFRMLGISTGPAAALLVTLPAISLPSLLLVSKAFPRKVLVFVLGSVILAGIFCGFVGWLWL
ncbi:permease [Paenibacillus sp. N4]|uniref:permease n=1 Tax=Paenibacillus vietnamensis TaxID=2590547 RepID=UPI001CD141B3|nr:permease [Paenibacillus vietnamensis]MCA0753780.1 permease [Paenibacillus vietnamensis]